MNKKQTLVTCCLLVISLSTSSLLSMEEATQPAASSASTNQLNVPEFIEQHQNYFDMVWEQKNWRKIHRKHINLGDRLQKEAATVPEQQQEEFAIELSQVLSDATETQETINQLQEPIDQLECDFPPATRNILDILNITYEHYKKPQYQPTPQKRKTVSLEGKNKITIVPSLQQVIQGAPADSTAYCGYYALWNSWRTHLHPEELSDSASPRLNRTLFAQVFQAMLRRVKELRRQNGRAAEHYENLNRDELQYLLEQFENPAISVELQNLFQPAAYGMPLDEALENSYRAEMIQSFISGLLDNLNIIITTGVTGGHYIMVRAHRNTANNTVLLTVADSLPLSSEHPEYLQKFLRPLYYQLTGHPELLTPEFGMELDIVSPATFGLIITPEIAEENLGISQEQARSLGILRRLSPALQQQLGSELGIILKTEYIENTSFNQTFRNYLRALNLSQLLHTLVNAKLGILLTPMREAELQMP